MMGSEAIKSETAAMRVEKMGFISNECIFKASPPAPSPRGERSEMLCGNVVKASPPAPLQRGEGSEMLCGLTGERVERWKGERVKR